MAQVRRSVQRDLSTARALYHQQVEKLQLTVVLVASGTTIPRHLSDGTRLALRSYLEDTRKEMGFDFLALTDVAGRTILRASPSHQTGDDVSSISVVGAALAGRAAAATEILPAELLEREDPALRARVRMRILETLRAHPSGQVEETSGMALIAAAPVRGLDGRMLGALYGGTVLNRNFEIVDRVWELVSKGERFDGHVGSATIFQGDLRISTNVRTASGERAVGTRVSAEVNDAVLLRGQTWLGRAFVVRDLYISGYEPIRNYNGKIIGMLYVGLLEAAYTSIRNRVIFSFFGIATIGFILIIGITYYEIRGITRPIAQMVAATQNIAMGRFDQEVEAKSQGEIALLAESFNTMLKSLRRMKADLEAWGRILEQKVAERTEELVAMQARVAQSERLASLGMLAAGVAHEINNPLGGILALTALTLEDLPPDDPNRENLTEVLHQSQRCRDIVRGLLKFSRQSKILLEPVDLNKILQDTLSLISTQSAFFNVAIVKDWDPQLPAVMGDKSQLEQVFMNILVNAAQAMDEKGAISIVTRRHAHEGIEVLISDTGRGIPKEEVSRIFDPFFTTKAERHGTGLGLSIAYGIITSHKGTISVQSEAGKGTAFTIRLPAASTVPAGGQN
jgi:two-component system NtrC family sensor kinase